jgi:hypothetical protein
MHNYYNTKKAFPEREEGKALLIKKYSIEGLSTAHIRPQNLSCGLFWLNAGKMKVSRNFESPGQKGGGKRGKVRGYSKQSKRKFDGILAEIDRNKQALFNTLTFPDEYFEMTEDYKDWKVKLNNLIKRFRREFPKAGIIWKLELKKRLSGKHINELFPHYHLLTYNVEYQKMLAWLAVNWWEVCGKLSDQHLAAGTRVEIAGKGAARYISKYMGKDIEFGNMDTGRCWGVINPENIPFVKAILCELTEEEAVKLIRYMRRYARIHGRDMKCLTIFCNPDFWYEKLPEILHSE